jgi:hypothetical protein
MRALLLAALLLASACAAAAGVRSAPEGLSDARAARSLLGPGTWARVVRIDNGGARGAERRNAYPPVVFALVFELSGVLWFYCDEDGTQSLSLRRGSLEADKADPGPLFRAIYDRFGAWSWVDDPPASGGPAALIPPNACFIECVAALKRRIAAGEGVDAPRLLSYYVDTPHGRLGHTVLLFDSRSGLAALDPERSETPVMIPGALGPDSRSLARYLRGGAIAAARVLPISAAGPLRPADRWAALSSGASPAG